MFGARLSASASTCRKVSFCVLKSMFQFSDTFHGSGCISELRFWFNATMLVANADALKIINRFMFIKKARLDILQRPRLAVKWISIFSIRQYGMLKIIRNGCAACQEKMQRSGKKRWLGVVCTVIYVIKWGAMIKGEYVPIRRLLRPVVDSVRTAIRIRRVGL